MAPIPIDPELIAKLTANGGEVPRAGPDGQPVGYFLSPDAYAAMRKVMYDWAKAQVTTEELRRAAANPKKYTMAEVLKLVEGD